MIMKKIISLGGSARGFNMFSALVAIILVMVGVVMTNTLISSEEKTNGQIYSMLTNYQLSDAANLARADALQNFNYNFREKFEDYLTFSGNKLENENGLGLFTIMKPADLADDKFTFDKMKSAFEINLLNTNVNDGNKFDAVVRFVSERTIDQFDPTTYGRFNVYLNDTSIKAKDAITNAVRKSVQKDFLQVLDCGDSECKNGSFYFNIPLNNLSDEDYEALPRIVVKDNVTLEEIKMPILPRTNLKVYIPLRFFKALFEARKTAKVIQAAHQELAKLKLGFCDDLKCSPRTDPKNSVLDDKMPTACPKVDEGSITNLVDNTGTEINVLGIKSYLSGGSSPGVTAIRAFGAREICALAVPPISNTFISDDASFVVRDSFLNPRDYGGEAIDDCGFSQLFVATASYETKLITGEGAGARLVCSRIRSVLVDVVFKETNPLYIEIRIEDTSYDPVPMPEDADLLPKCVSDSTSCKPQT
ncbi:MAG: hypothetical protein NTY48_01080 [Candidatus Diapherotrites archaeon]|nr:hypothetical protein [Candidatus Diapherotrites archaeon]